MELLEALRIIKKQLKVVIPLLAIAFVLALLLVSQIETRYESRGTVTLLNSSAESTENPYLRFDQSLQTTAQVLGDTVSTNEARKSFEDKGLSPDYEVAVPYDPTQTILLPMLEVSVLADSEKVASATRDELIVDVKNELAAKQTQAGAPSETWIQAFSTSDREVVAVSGSKARTFVIVFGLGAAFAIAVAFIIDGFKRGVKNTRRGSTVHLEAAKPLKGEEAPVAPVKTSQRKSRQRTQRKDQENLENKSANGFDELSEAKSK